MFENDIKALIITLQFLWFVKIVDIAYVLISFILLPKRNTSLVLFYEIIIIKNPINKTI